MQNSEIDIPHNPKFDDWVYLISVLTGPLTVLIAAIIAIAASTNLVADQSRAQSLTQFATLLLTGGAAVTGTTQARRPGIKADNVAIGREVNEVNVNAEQQPDAPNNSNNGTSHPRETSSPTLTHKP